MEKYYKNKNLRRRSLSLTLKKLSIEYKGGKCDTCKGIFSPRIYCFHHVDEKLKRFEIKEFLSHFKSRPNKFAETGYKILIEELDKCLLLCHNCHHKLHEDEDFDEEADEVSKELIINDKFRELFKLKKIIKKKNKPKIRGK